jgi:FkbM family methyltransferase
MKRWLINELFQFVVLKKLYHQAKDYDFVINNDWIGYNIILNGYYEKEQLSEIIKRLNFDIKTYDLLDIGANIGNHTVFFSKYFKHIHSFEPQLRTFQILKLNTSRLGNVSLNNFGISTEEREVIFKIPFNNSGAASQVSSELLYYEELVNLKNIPNHNYSDVSVIKLDVEGSEIDVINSCKGLIDLTKPILLFELNKNADHALLDLLKNLGYSNFYSQGKLDIMNRFSGRSLFHKIFRLFLRGIYYKRNKNIYKVTDFKNIDYPLVIATHPDSMFSFNY